MNFEGSLIDFFSKGKMHNGRGGIYFLYGKDGCLLNIGNTDNLYVIIYQKWVGKNGGSKADYYFCDYYEGIALFCEENFRRIAVYEPYLINKLQPPLNDKLQ